MTNSSTNLPARIREQLQGYLACIQLQEEPGLLIVEEESLIEGITAELKAHRLEHARGWKELMERLKTDRGAFIVLDGPLPRELRDIITQYDSRPHTIQVMSPEISGIECININKDEAPLLIVTTPENLKAAEASFPIKQRVGLTEYISL